MGCEDIEHVFRGCSVSLGIWENIILEIASSWLIGMNGCAAISNTLL